MTDDTRTILQQKADAFCLLNKFVHITYKKNGSWKNGRIKEVKREFFIMDERLEGEVIVFFDELNDIREYVNDE